LPETTNRAYSRSRRLWADYFDTQGVCYAFYSAANAVALQEAKREAVDTEMQLTMYEEADIDEKVSEGELEEEISEGLPSKSLALRCIVLMKA